MLVLTGRLPSELPAVVVRQLMHRVSVRAAWDPELVASIRAPISADAPFHDRIAKMDARDWLARTEAVLFPADD